ncbi:unnamed protein product [Camellia sinensis]
MVPIYLGLNCVAIMQIVPITLMYYQWIVESLAIGFISCFIWML